MPLVADGRAIGTLIIDSRRPRRFSEVEVRLLRLMANQAALAIEKARHESRGLKGFPDRVRDHFAFVS